MRKSSNLYVVALYDYDGSEQASLYFQKGDVVEVLNQLESGWWDGICEGKRGWFPSNYVSILEEGFTPTTPPDLDKTPSNSSHPQQKTGYYYNLETGETVGSVISSLDKQSNNNSNSDSPHSSLGRPESISRRRQTPELSIETSKIHMTMMHQANNHSMLQQLIHNSSGKTGDGPSHSTAPLIRDRSTYLIPSNFFESMVNVKEKDEFMDLPPLWGRKVDQTGKIYFYHMLSDHTRWLLTSPSEDNWSLETALETWDSSILFNGLPPIERENQNAPWTLLLKVVQTSIEDFLKALKENRNQDFSNLSSTVVEAIRMLLYLTGTGKKDAMILRDNKSLRHFQKLMMTTLSQLVLESKIACSIWPPPNATQKAFDIIRSLLFHTVEFIRACWSSRLPLMTNDPMFQKLKNKEWQSHDMESYNHDMYKSLKEIHDKCFRSILVIEKHNQPDSANSDGIPTITRAAMIGLVRNCVTEIGLLLSAVDELKFSNVPTGTEKQFKFSHLTLYNSISELVVATQASPVSPSNKSADPLQLTSSPERFHESLKAVKNSLEDLWISCKLVIEEIGLFEQNTLLTYLSQYNHQVTAASGGSDTLLESPPTTQMPNQVMILSPSFNSPQTTLHSSEPFSGRTFTPPASSLELPGAASSPPKDRIMMKLVHQPPPASPERRPLIRSSTNDSFNNASATSTSSSISSSFNQLLRTEILPDDIILNVDGDIKAATLPVLVERITSHEAADINLTHTFLMTYRSFCSSNELFSLLTQRFLLSVPKDLSQEDYELWVVKKLSPIRVRVFNVFRLWVEEYLKNTPEDTQVMMHMKSFALSNVVRTEMDYSMGIKLEQTIENKLVQELQKNPYRTAAVLHSSKVFAAPLVPKNLDSKKFKLMDLDPLEMARQLTLMQTTIFLDIHYSEFFNKSWSHRDPDTSPHIKAMIQFSTAITEWVTNSILRESDVRKRSNVVKYYITVALKMRSLNNFDGLMAILASLNSSPIHRLNRTFELLSNKIMVSLEQLRHLMDPTKNFSNYRELVKIVRPPSVPFLGFYLTDLTFIEDGNKNIVPSPMTGKPLIHFFKRTLSVDVIRDFQRLQALTYPIMPVEYIQKLIRWNMANSKVDRDPYDVSLMLEPRETDEDKIARLLEESGFV